MRQQLGHSRKLTIERDEESKLIYRSYETPILVINADDTVAFADTRFYSATTSRHQMQLAHYRQDYVLPKKRERVVYEYCLKHAGNNATGCLYTPCYRAKDNPYDPWHDEQALVEGKRTGWDWETAYGMLHRIAADKTGLYGEQIVHANFVGTF